MSSCDTSSFDSAIMRSVWAKVLTVETVRVRSFLRPRISKWPAFGSYLTLLRLRSGNLRLGFWRLRMERRISSAVFSIFFTVSVAIRSSLLFALQAAPARAPNTRARIGARTGWRSEEHTSELQSRFDLVCRLL